MLLCVLLGWALLELWSCRFGWVLETWLRSREVGLESFGIDENWVLKKSERQGFRHVCVRKACKSLLTGSQGGSIVGVRKGNPSFLSYSSQKWVLFFSDSDWFDLVCLILLFLFVPGIQHCSSMIHRRIACRSRFIRSFVATVWSMATARWGKKWGSPIWSGLLLPRHHGPAGSSSKSRPGWNAASGRQSIVCSVIVNPMVIRCYQQHLYLYIYSLSKVLLVFLSSVICVGCVCVSVCLFVCVCLSGKNCFNSVLLQDQFSFCNHTMLGDIRAAKLCQSPLFGLYLFDSLVFRIDRHEIAIPGRVCCRWHSVFHRGWAQADVGVCSYMGGLNLGHWTLWPSRTLEIMESKSAVGSTSKTFLTNCPLIFCGKPAYQHIMNKSGIRNYCYQHLLMKSNHPVSPTPVTSL